MDWLSFFLAGGEDDDRPRNNAGGGTLVDRHCREWAGPGDSGATWGPGGGTGRCRPHRMAGDGYARGRLRGRSRRGCGGARNLEKRGKCGRRRGRDDPGSERDRLAGVLFWWRSADHGLRRPATWGHCHRRPGGRASAGDPRTFQGARRDPRQRDRGRGRTGRARRLPLAARPVWHDDFHPGDRTHPGASPPSGETTAMARRFRANTRNTR